MRSLGIDWNYLLNAAPGAGAGRHRRRVEADQLQLPVLPGRPAVDPEVADRGRGDRRSGPCRRFWTIVFPLLSPTTFFLLVVNIVYAFFDTFAIDRRRDQRRTRPGRRDPGVQGVLGRRAGARPRRLRRAVGGPDGDRHLADGGPVPLHRAPGPVLIPPWSSAARSEPSISHAGPDRRRGDRGVAALRGFRRLRRCRSTRSRPCRCRCCRGRTCSTTIVAVLSHGSKACLRRAGGHDDVEQPGDGARHRDRQDRDLDALGVRDRLFPLSAAQDRVLDDLPYADAAGGGAHLPDLQGRRRARAGRHLRGAHAAADRLGDGDVPVPPVLPDDSGGARRGGAHRRRRPDALLLSTSCCRCRAPAWPRCSSSCSSTAGTSTCGRC